MLLWTGLGATFLMMSAVACTAGNVDVTPALRQKAEAICTADAMRLCADAIGDDGQIVACMRQQRAKLTTPCRQVYDQVARALSK